MIQNVFLIFKLGLFIYSTVTFYKCKWNSNENPPLFLYLAWTPLSFIFLRFSRLHCIIWPHWPLSEKGLICLSLCRPVAWLPATFSELGDYVYSEKVLLWNIWLSFCSLNLRRWGTWTWIRPVFCSLKGHAMSRSKSASLSESLRELPGFIHSFNTYRGCSGTRNLMLPRVSGIPEPRGLRF